MPYTFSTASFGNGMRMGGNAFVRCSQSQHVPCSRPFSQSDRLYWDNVRVPNGEVVPMGCERNINMMPQFNGDLFQCPDGTLLDIRTHRVVREADDGRKGYWGNENIISPFDPRREKVWDDREIIDSMINGTDDMGMSVEDREYNEFLRHKDNELKNNMNELQKEMLRRIENGQYNSISRLKEEK